MSGDSSRASVGVMYVRQHWRLILLGCLVAFQALNSWAWLSTNVSILNSDTRRHLMTTLTYSDTLRRLNLADLFDMIITDEYRPPLFQFSAVPLLWLFGRSTDVATMVNAVYMAVLLGATYAIGRKVSDSDAGLLACFVLSTFPMIYAMSRYFFIDFALTAVVALNLALLLHTRDFERKGYTLLYGLSFGLGMLVKWTFVVFALVPVVLVFLRSGLPRRMLREVKTIKVDGRWALLSALMALALALLWYLPNLDRAREMFLGLWLLPLCWLSLALTFYALSRPSSQAANLFGAAMVGVASASIWYLPRIDFVRQFFLVAYGKPKGRFWGFVPYLNFLVDEQLSPFYVVILLLALLILVLLNRRRLRVIRRRSTLTGDLAVLGSWAVLPYLVFSFNTSTIHSRYIMPILPPLALLIACALLRIPWTRMKAVLLTVVVMIALTQFFALSYDGLGWLRDVATVELSDVRELNLFAHGSQNQLPNTGPTDSRYWVMPDIVKFIREDCLRIGRPGAELGILTKTPHVQASTFWLVSMVEGYSELTMRELARAWSSAPVYPQLFEVDYLVLKDGSQEGINRPETRQLVGAMLSGSAPFVSEVFEVAQQYPLPDGDTVYLYRKKYHLGEEHNQDDYQALGHDLEAVGNGDQAIIFEIPEQIEVFAPHYRGAGVPYPLPREQPLDEREVLPDLEAIAANHDTIFAILWAEERVDPGHFVEQWLNQHGYRALTSWYGPVQLVVYGSPLVGEVDAPATRVEARFGESIDLLGYSLDAEKAEPGRIVRLTLFWQTEGSIEKDYKVFVHLLDRQGQILAQHDSPPVGGSMSTAGWVEGETIVDNHGILIPPGAPPGEYQLVLGMYEPETQERVPVISGGEVAGDDLLLTRITIESG